MKPPIVTEAATGSPNFVKISKNISIMFYSNIKDFILNDPSMFSSNSALLFMHWYLTPSLYCLSAVLLPLRQLLISAALHLKPDLDRIARSDGKNDARKD